MPQPLASMPGMSFTMDTMENLGSFFGSSMIAIPHLLQPSTLTSVSSKATSTVFNHLCPAKWPSGYLRLNKGYTLVNSSHLKHTQIMEPKDSHSFLDPL